MVRLFVMFSGLLLLCPVLGSTQQLTAPRIDLGKPVTLPAPQPVRWCGREMATGHYGFFCRQELKADKKLLVPVRVRLGSMQMTDWLENKPNAQKPDR